MESGDRGHDELGWARGPIDPLPVSSAYTLFVESERVSFELGPLVGAARHFGVRVGVTPQKTYPRGSLPRSDDAILEVGVSESAPALVRVQFFPIERGRELVRLAREVARSQGGGLDHLVGRARRIVQVELLPELAPRPPLLVAGILATALLAPILPPEADRVFGVKGARERLEALEKP